MNHQQQTNNHNGNARQSQPSLSTGGAYEPLKEENYVARAEKVMLTIAQATVSKSKKISTTQIRNILSMVNQIYNDVIISTESQLSEQVLAHLQYHKVRIIYNAGRNEGVKEFMKQSDIVEHLDHIGQTKAGFLLYAHYMEALVAYHKFYNINDF